MTRVAVKASRQYDILIGQGLSAQIGSQAKALFPKAEKAAVITDSQVEALYLEPVKQALEKVGFEAPVFSFPPGEVSKSGATYLSLLHWLTEQGLSRSDVIIALGGGVVGDVSGFAAATYLRGVPYVQMPTTLLAMVDSSIGGKTAINLTGGKNLAGTFYQPALVLCDTDALSTLPDTIYRDGLAEVIKYGMLGSRALLEALDSQKPLDLEQVIALCVTMKRDIVEQDEFDLGQRMLLNLGHTIGHAIERLSGYSISHGAAVSIGMAIDTRSAVRGGLCPPDCLHMLERLLSRFHLPNRTNFSSENIYHAALGDKKRSGEEITIPVPRTLGQSELKTISTDRLLTWIERGLQP